MHLRLLTNFLLRHFHAPLRPPLQRLPTQGSRLLDQPFLDRVGLLETPSRILDRHRYRYEPVAKIGMRTQKSQQRFVAEIGRRHLFSFPRIVDSQSYSASL